jgi:hypothetical protein
MSAKLMPTFADRKCRVDSAADSYGRILGVLDRSRFIFFQVVPQYLNGITENRTRVSGSAARKSYTRPQKRSLFIYNYHNFGH